jgi:hypothetical protein
MAIKLLAGACQCVVCPHCGDVTKQDVLLAQFTCGVCDRGFAPRSPDTKPCTVLDCFSGASTTLLVADRLQRDAIGIELSTDYGAMATGRIEQDAPLFAGVVEEPAARDAPLKEVTGPRHDGNSWKGGVAPPPRPARIVDDAPLLAWGAVAEEAAE